MNKKEDNIANSKEQHIALLKEYLTRLGTGESIEKVQKDFVKNFKDVDAMDIMKAEQSIMAEGTPLEQVQKLCDIHSALFHGKTKEERITKSENAVRDSLSKDNKMTITKALISQKGHPLELFFRENEALSKVVCELKERLRDGFVDLNCLEKVREVAIHYAKKGDLIYPLLKVRYGIAGPSDVMWTVDDEIRDEMAMLAKKETIDSEWRNRFEVVLVRIEEMIYKENNILFPICAANFSKEEWISLYHDQKDYAMCLDVEPNEWKLAEESLQGTNSTVSGEEIVLAGGHMTVEQLAALLNTIPLEITFVDDKDINRFFNEGPKDFKRPKMAIDREVFSCHPPKIEAKVRHIIHQFRTGILDEVPVWMEKNGKCLLVKYMAVRDVNHQYLGTLELVQDMSFAKDYFLLKR